MKSKSQRGFSLIELLIVVVIIGIIAAIAIPSYQRAKVAAENRAAVALLSVIRSAQMNYYAQKGQYAPLDQLQQSQNGSLGTGWSATSGDRGNFTYTLIAANTTNYQIVAVRINDPSTFYTLSESGVIERIEGI